ncbi:MAG TPA: hypothetical protein VHE35_19160, partial [Kofleriaceae bacterium]|nr:hypothetical protein [Kofleriaceae bacterium]
MRLRRWLVSIGLGVVLLLGGLLVLVRVKFEGPDLGDGLSTMLSDGMRGRVSIGSVDWPMSALKTAVTGGWMPVQLRDVEVWDEKGVSVLQTPRITLELDLHSLMFGRHDFVLRNIHVIGGHVLLREMTEPYPLHDYDTTVFSLLAAFYGKRSVAGYYVGVQATSAPLFDLRDYHIEGVEVEILMTPYGKNGDSYQVHADLEKVTTDGFLYMDSSDPIVPRFYTSLRPRASGGQIDLFWEKGRDGRYAGEYTIPIDSLVVNRLQQVPANWPSSSVANTLVFDLDLETKDAAHVKVDGAMIDYWADVYDGKWDVKVDVTNAGPMLRHTFDPDIGGDHVTVHADITGPIIAYPKIDLTLKGLTYDLELVTPPLHLELETLHVGYDLVVDRGEVDQFVAHGAGGTMTISGDFGGDSTNESPFLVNGEVRIDDVDLAGRLPPCIEDVFGSKLSGHLKLKRATGETALVYQVNDLGLRLGKLAISGDTVTSDVAFGNVSIGYLKAQFEGTSGWINGSLNTSTRALQVKGHTQTGDLQGLMRKLECWMAAPPAARRQGRTPDAGMMAPVRGRRPPMVARR